MWRIEEHLMQTPYMETATTRTVRVYLPYNYDNDDTRYPVVYFHDGKAVFFGKGPFNTGSWEVLDTITAMEQAGKTKGMIIVAIDNADTERPTEYLPFVSSYIFKEGFDINVGGKAHEYAKFFVNTLVPFINAKYKTIPEDAAIIGSSMGGLVTAFIISQYPTAFAKAGIFSIASWVYTNNEWFDYLKATTPNSAMKYFIHVGTAEGHMSTDPLLAQKYVNDTIAYFRTLLQLGVPLHNIYLNVGVGDTHSESTWSKYIESFLLY
ncbi:alpha/beta hydrolase [Candidatus Epulonipiscium viviparus]|uniref:alpha/beta hydrolase n=1 Tax=Candidatus Epulonipiscium viviparus TaxID=420336 RepID=UPI0027381483|nr:alpha/beta hydrolase-fold protein [Candidatus Epulopiscium viviparus]